MESKSQVNTCAALIQLISVKKSTQEINKSVDQGELEAHVINKAWNQVLHSKCECVLSAHCVCARTVLGAVSTSTNIVSFHYFGCLQVKFYSTIKTRLKSL